MRDSKDTHIDWSSQKRPCSKTIVDLLRQRAGQEPEKKGYVYLPDGNGEEISLSYRELDLRARAIGESLIKRGIRDGRALLLYPPGLDFITGFFGCLYAGLVAVPAYPARNARGVPRLRSIVRDAQAKIALTTSSILAKTHHLFAQADDLAALNWLATDEVERGMADGWQPPEAGGGELAFLQYTSGSTGDPKGVSLTHNNLLHNADLIYNAFEHTQADRYVSWLPTFHDMGFMVGVLQPLYAGVQVVLMSPVTFLQHPIQWLRAISHYRGTTSGGPNFAYELCAHKIAEEQLSLLDLSSWTVAFNGAEPVRAETLQRFAKVFERCGFRREAFYPCYGLAEATLAVSGGRKSASPIIKKIRSDALQNGQAVETVDGHEGARTIVGCGSALGGQKIEIVNTETNAKCPPGEVGEIWVSGPSIAPGYWKRSAETEQTFRAYIPDTEEGPFLRTGDLGFIQGRELFVTGRLKDLIIIRGINHYPQDIELTVEASHPALRPGCGAAFSIEINSEEKLVIVQEVDGRRKFDPSEVILAIRKSVSENHELQAYASVLVKPGTIPKTSSGKIQRDACRKAFLSGNLDEVHRSVSDDCRSQLREDSYARKALLAIDSEKRLSVAESYVMELGSRVLQVPLSQMHPERPLSAFGLDSLMALELKSQIETQLGVPVSASTLLGADSIRQIASHVLERLAADSAMSTGFGGSDDESRIEFPLSYTQKALWFFHQLAPKSAAYNTALAIQISSRIDLMALREAFRTLVARHPCLRTTFDVVDGEPIQRVHQQFRGEICEVPASALAPDNLRRAITDEACRPFDLERGPVCRVSLFTRSPEERLLLLAAHHIVIDGWSYWVLLDELIELYQAEVAGAPRTIPPPPQYADYVYWQSEMLKGEEGERLFEYWKRELSGDLPILKLPTLRPRPPIQTYSGASHEFKLDDELVQELKRVASSRNATLYMILLSAFQVLLHRYTGQDDILVGSPVSGRSRAEFEGIVGCLFNTVVLRADFSFDRTFEEFLDQVRVKVLCALDHQDYPVHLLIERLQPARDSGRSTLFQVTFTLQKSQRHGLAPIPIGKARPHATSAGLEIKLLPVERRYARVDLELEIIEAGSEAYAWLHYNKDLFEAPTIVRLADHFQTLLKGVIADPGQRLSSLPLLTEVEMAHLLAEQNSGVGSSDNYGIEELFLEQVNKTPEKVAAVYDESLLTYNELNEQSGRLAGLIRTLMK